MAMVEVLRRSAGSIEQVGLDVPPTRLRFEVAATMAAFAARRLVLSVGPVDGAFIGVAIDGGLEMFLTYLVVWLAGAAIVPVDASEPPARFRAMLADDVRARCVIAAARKAAPFGESDVGCAVVFAQELFAPSPCDAPCAAPHDPASAVSHCFFTSGTTGRPKGCVVTHASLQAYALARNARDGVTSSSRIFCASAPTFDPSLGDLAQSIVASCVLCVPVTRPKLGEIGRFLKICKATHITATPTVWGAQRDDDVAATALDALQCVSLGGEALTARIVQLLGPSGRLRCIYGATEACIYQTSFIVKTVDQIGTVGEALDSVKLLLKRDDADSDDAFITATGVEGEIWVGGEQVRDARYAGDETQTRAKFIDVKGEAFYRTGDVGAWDAAGQLRLLGRKDDQVKLNGRRIELTGVDFLVGAAAPEIVRRAATVVVNDALVCCVECHAESDGALLEFDASAAAALASAALRWCLVRNAPAHLVPLIVVVSALPTTATGKVARSLISASGAALVKAQRNSLNGGTAASTPTQLAVARCWSGCLQKMTDTAATSDDDAVISPGTDFFAALGGDSLVALRVSRRIAAWLHGRGFRGQDDDAVDATEDADATRLLVALYDARTCAAFADVVDGLLSARSAESAEAVAGFFQNANVAFDAGSGRKRGRDAADGLAGGPEVPSGAASDGFCLVAAACAAGSASVVSALLRHGARCDSTKADATLTLPPLSLAARAGHFDCVTALVARGAKVTAPDKLSKLPLHHAATAETAQALLDAGAPLAATDRTKQSALHTAARAGAAAVLAVLCGHATAHPDPNPVKAHHERLLDRRDRWARTALHWAVLNGHFDCVAALLAAGAQATPTALPTGKVRKATTAPAEAPLDTARRLKRDDIVALLLKHQQS
ncbi:hypothetical protein M885DRAFT_531253 [Pelagophyceae sp. CCMP2097]|nr:hypothetical protein M885DRAFT_531253 [Pelagophyceae sp. CCMP2097]